MMAIPCCHRGMALRCRTTLYPSHRDEVGVGAVGSSMRASTLFESNREADSSVRDTYGLGGRPALRDPCRVRGYLEIVCLAQGRVIFAGSTFRREKMRCDLFTGRSITAQSRCNSTSLPPLMAHKRPALPE
jgi:hypothetical protein